MRWGVLALLSSMPNQAMADHLFEGRDIAAGAALYVENCASCHGVALEGQPDWQSPGEDGLLPAPPHDDSGHTWHHDTGLLFDYTKFGGEVALADRGVTGFSSGMPAFAEVLTDAEIYDLLAYIRSTWSERSQRVQAARSHPGN